MDEGRVAGALKQQRWACSLRGGGGEARDPRAALRAAT